MNDSPATVTRHVGPTTRRKSGASAVRPRLAAVLAALLWLSAPTVLTPPAIAQAAPATSSGAPDVVPQRDLERALSAPRTRGLRIAPRAETAPPEAPQAPSSPTGNPTGTDGSTGAAPAGAAPEVPAAASVALDVPFEINSSALRPAAAAQLEQLAAALRSEALAPFRFLIAGHTDASGDANYNRRLSGRRADAVRRQLIDAGVDARRLDARGFGEDELLDPRHPTAAANRRVEIRNLGVAGP